jgi:phosphatidylserine/phosphatidylglycerophosphate/cardiolipin synthase-like enzyme
VCFTDPTNPTATSYRGGIDEALAEAIDQARLSVDVAIYDLNLWSIRDALINAHRRGVAVRLLTDSDNMDEMEIQELKEAGIEVLGDRRESLMHDKYVIIDRSEVWTGSMNFTTGGAYLDNNNLIRRDHQTGGGLPAIRADVHRRPLQRCLRHPSPYPAVTVNGSLIEVYFSPQDGTLGHILSCQHSFPGEYRFPERIPSHRMSWRKL